MEKPDPVGKSNLTSVYAKKGVQGNIKPFINFKVHNQKSRIIVNSLAFRNLIISI